MPAKDYAITLNTDTPSVFDAIQEYLEDHGANWDAVMTCKPTGDTWECNGAPAPTALNEPVRLRLVEEDEPKRQPKRCMIPGCGCDGDAHP